MRELAKRHWSGGPKSLKRCLEMMLLLNESDTLCVEDIPAEFREVPVTSPVIEQPDSGAVPIFVGMTMADAERELIVSTLDSMGNNKTQTARVLNIGLRTLFRKIKDYGIG